MPRDIQRGAAKVWLNLDGVGSVNARVSYNVASVADNGTGAYIVTIDTDFSGADYVVVLGSEDATNEALHAGGIGASTMAAGSFHVGSVRDDGTTGVPASQDANVLMVACFGDQ